MENSKLYLLYCQTMIFQRSRMISYLVIVLFCIRVQPTCKQIVRFAFRTRATRLKGFRSIWKCLASKVSLIFQFTFIAAFAFGHSIVISGVFSAARISKRCNFAQPQQSRISKKQIIATTFVSQLIKGVRPIEGFRR